MRRCERCNELVKDIGFKNPNSTVCKLCSMANRINKLTNRINTSEIIPVNQLDNKVVVLTIGDVKNRTMSKENLLKAHKKEELFPMKKDLVVVKHVIPRKRSSQYTIEKVKRKYNYICKYCGGEADTIDHFIPLSKGGTWDEENLVPSCLKCNESKADDEYKNVTVARSSINIKKKKRR